MRRSKAELRQELTQDDLIAQLRRDYKKIEDHRAPNIIHELEDVLMSAYAMFALKYSSLLSFEEQTKTEKENLRTVFGIEQLVSDAQMRKILDEVPPDNLQGLFPSRLSLLEELGIKKEYLFLGKHLLIPIDGVHYFSSKKIKCEKCSVQHHENGEITYSHSMLGAVLVHPERREVFPLGGEAIEKQDGSTKNDCELNASKRLQRRLFKDYKDEPFLIVEDALYGNEPHIEQVLSNGWNYIINVKPSSHESLFKHFEARKERNQIKEKVIKEDGYTHYFYWMNNVPLNGQGNVRCNFLYYEEHDSKGKVKRFSWVTSLKLLSNNVYRIMKGGRSRWKIENETFNTLKNQGYHFAHNYGHGKKHLCNVLALMMLMAFFIDQLMQTCSKLFNQILKKAKTKKKVWKTMLALYLTTILKSFEDLLRKLAIEFEILME